MSTFERATRKTFSDGKSTYYYWIAGDTRNPTLLLLPGFTGTHTDLLPLAEELKKSFYIIIPDLPGWGESPRLKQKLTIDHYSVYLHSLLHAIGVSKIYLFGHCMGATLALQYAIHYPQSVKKLIIVSTPYNEGLLSQRLFLHLADISTHSPKFFRPFLFLWRSRFFSTPLCLLSMQFRSFHKKIRIIVRGIRQQPHQHEDVVEENWVSLVHFHYGKTKELTMPILIIHGDKDLLVSPKQADRLHLLLPNAQLRFISDAGHIPPVETPGTLAVMVAEFLNAK